MSILLRDEEKILIDFINLHVSCIVFFLFLFFGAHSTGNGKEKDPKRDKEAYATSAIHRSPGSAGKSFCFIFYENIYVSLSAKRFDCIQ